MLGASPVPTRGLWLWSPVNLEESWAGGLGAGVASVMLPCPPWIWTPGVSAPTLSLVPQGQSPCSPGGNPSLPLGWAQEGVLDEEGAVQRGMGA